MLSATSLTVTDTVTGTYENTLRVAMGEVGTYECNVSNSRSSASRSLTVVGKNYRESMYVYHEQGVSLTQL